MKQVYVTFILIFGLQFGFGQIGFEEQVIIDNNSFPEPSDFAGMFDMDGDGDNDMLTTLFWYENTDGLGEYGAWHYIGNSYGSVHGADIDGDGDIDVVSTSVGTGIITWYENIDGQNSFGSPQNIATASFSTAMGVVDMDGDGDTDVYYYSDTSDGVDRGIFWYDNDGQGNFSTIKQSTYLVEYSYHTEVYTVDINGDNYTDFITSNDENLYWYKNSDTGLGSLTRYLIAEYQSPAESINANDIDNDGDMDIIVTLPENDEIIWHENDGQGNFGPKQVITDIAEEPILVSSKDMDGDGDIDLITFFDDTDKLAWFENTDGQGTFGAQQTVAIGEGGGEWIYAYDFDNDGDKDIFNGWFWYENTDGQANFGLKQPLRFSSYDPKSLDVADLDGDSYDDVLMATGDDRIAWYKNMNGQGNFGTQQIVTFNAIRARGAKAADLDGDGDMDVVSAELQKIALYENDGLGIFSEGQIVGTLNYSEALHIADIDNDGDKDVLAGSSNGNVIWYENIDGQANFGQEQIVGDIDLGTSAVNSLRSIYSADIDGDGDTDFLIAASYTDEIVWFENTDGLGNFGTRHIITDGIDSPGFALADDIDNDGDMDVISAFSSLDIIVWYENLDGNGDFGVQQMIATNVHNPTSSYLVDMDNDGDIDVLSALASNDKIAWFENTNGLGLFGAEQLISTNADGANAVFAKDINGDGRIDVLSTSVFDDKLAWYKNIDVISNKITGSVMYDLNLDGCDDMDLLGDNIQITTQNAEDSFTTFSLNNGLYQTFPGEGEYTTSITSSLPPYCTVVLNDQVSNFTGIGNVETIDFCIQATQSIDDLNILVLPLNQARPGFDVSYQLVYENHGTTQLDGAISLDFNDSSLTFLNASETLASQTSNTITFDFTGINPFESRTIDLQFNILPPPTVNGDDALQFTADITSNGSENTPEDNTYLLEQIVVNSFDPNDKLVLQGDVILEEEVDNYLDYIVRFQNTGTSSAINVILEDVLDSKLDWETLRPISSSHNYTVQVTNGNTVEFIFNDIFLPDSTTDEPNSKGFMAFKIKPKGDVQVGDIITGTADIFFDFNPPITTNNVSTEIVETLSLTNVNTHSFNVFPNPAQSELSIKGNRSINHITIVDVNGRLLKSINHSGLTSSTIINVEDLNCGIYFLNIESESTKQAVKFVKN